MTHPRCIIIGAMKCGTSTLAAQLGDQKGAFLTDPKEPNYFSDDAVFAKGGDWYARLFQDADAQDITIDASTHYTKLPTHPKTLERLSQAGVTPKLIYLIRDPIERLVSHYIHEWTMGKMSGGIDQAVLAHGELVDYSRYGFQIAPWVDVFGADSILVLTAEQMRSAPEATLSQAARHIGLDDATWNSTLGAQNVSAERVRRYPLHSLVFDNDFARSIRRALVPNALRQRLKSARQMTQRPVLSEVSIDRLQAYFRADYAELVSHFPSIGGIEETYERVFE